MTAHMRPALDVLAELRRGRLNHELTEALHELLQSCQETGKKGSLTLTLTVEPKKVGEFETPQISVTDQVGVKKPRKSVHPSTFFLTDDGVPVRRDPNQEAFESLREVPTEPADTSSADSTRKAI